MAINITDRFIVEKASEWFNEYQYFGVGTGTTGFSGTESDLISPVQIGTGTTNRNKIFHSGSTSFISTGSTGFVHLFRLNSLEPNSQPVNLGEVGLFKTEDDNNDMGSMTVFNVPQTKDNSVQWNIRFQGRVRKIE